MAGFWTAEREAALEQMAPHRTRAQIAGELGTTEQAIYNKLHRFKRQKTEPLDKAERERRQQLRLGHDGRHQGWTIERIDRLKLRWKEGDSAGIIADEIGVSRNAVLGKVHRLGLPCRRPGTSDIGETKRRKPRATIRFIKPPRFKSQPLPLPPTNAPPPRNLTILELAADDCRWAVTDDPPYLFCGHPAGELPYCGFHARIAYQPPRPRR